MKKLQILFISISIVIPTIVDAKNCRHPNNPSYASYCTATVSNVHQAPVPVTPHIQPANIEPSSGSIPMMPLAPAMQVPQIMTYSVPKPMPVIEPPKVPHLQPYLVPQPMQIQAPGQIPQLQPYLVPQPSQVQAPPKLPQLVPSLQINNNHKLHSSKVNVGSSTQGHKIYLVPTHQVAKTTTHQSAHQGRATIQSRLTGKQITDSTLYQSNNDKYYNCLLSGYGARVIQNDLNQVTVIGNYHSPLGIDRIISSLPARQDHITHCLIVLDYKVRQ